MKIIVDHFTFPETVSVGEYSAHSDAGPFPAWCAELSQYLYFGEMIEYDYVDGLSAWSAPISLALDQLMSWTAGAGWPSDAMQSAAVQRDIWSILGGGHGDLDIGQPVLTMHAGLLHNDARQDLLVVSSIAEPDPLALLIPALLVLAASRMVRQ